MARETEALLCSILYTAKMADSLEDVIAALEVMCTKEEIAVVEKAVAERKASKMK